MLSSTLFRAFTNPILYGLIVILLGTAVMQVRYVNKALQRFDSTQVIPIQFVLFTLSVIIGSAILYRDFERTTARQAAKFIGGCLLTFFGVFLITSGRPRHDDEEQLSDDENVEETIGLRDQEASGPYANRAEQPRPVQRQQQGASARSSRRSSRASRISFASTGGNPSSLPQNSIIPSTHKLDTSTSRITIPTAVESSPLLSNPWKNSMDEQSDHPGLPPRTSVDSVPTIYSIASNPISEPLQSNISLPEPSVPPPTPDRPMTPRAAQSSKHSHHFSNAFISPSPLSSTVSAVVADALLRNEENPSGRRRSIRRARPSIRSSFFVPHSEDGVSSAVGPLLQSDRENEEPPYQDDPLPDDQKTFRGRARSLSSALGDFFGRKRRRISDPEDPGIDHDSQRSNTSLLDQP